MQQASSREVRQLKKGSGLWTKRDSNSVKAQIDCILDGDTNFFNIVAGVLQRDILASYLSIIHLDSVLRTGAGSWWQWPPCECKQNGDIATLNVDS